MTENEIDLDAVEETLASSSSSHRPFYVPILRAIDSLGGSALKREVVRKARSLLEHHLNEKQLDYIEAKSRYGWARLTLRKNGLVEGEYGTWALTDLGRRYLSRHASDPIGIDVEIPESDEPRRSAIPTESVKATSYDGFHVPILETLAQGLTQKGQVFEAMLGRIAPSLLPGDRRKMPNGLEVWAYRSSWALTSLGQNGEAQNTGVGLWTITDAGRRRLEREAKSWDIGSFQNSKAKVQREEDSGKPGGPPPLPEPWDLRRWKGLAPSLPRTTFEHLTARLRPDLGPTPDSDRHVARNVILYGPPGTGKTHVAKLVAQALAPEDQQGETDRVCLVQFHPSYAYEDFVQGLRPDLKETELRYELERGPFLRIAEAAAQDPDAFHVLIIDEINRGDPARIFGELLYALEYRNEPVVLPLGGQLRVPPNLVIVGTMNSVDRSVALVDYALRRRFGFVRVDPDSSVIGAVHREGLLGEAGPSVLSEINRWLTRVLDREHALGHSFFINPGLDPDDERVFERIWALDVAPLLEEYFHGEADRLREARKVWDAAVTAAVNDRAEVVASDEGPA